MKTNNFRLIPTQEIFAGTMVERVQRLF